MTEAQAVLRAIAGLAVDDRLRQVWQAVPRAPDEHAMFEGRIPWDLPTELRTTVESLLEGEIRPAIESLERASHDTGSSGRGLPALLAGGLIHGFHFLGPAGHTLPWRRTALHEHARLFVSFGA